MLVMNKYLIPVFALAIAGYTTAPTDKPAEPQAPLATGLVAVTMQSEDGFAEISFAKSIRSPVMLKKQFHMKAPTTQRVFPAIHT